MKKRLIAAAGAVAYSIILLRVMVFKDTPTIRTGTLAISFAGTDGGHPTNFIPFKTIVSYLLGSHGPLVAGVNLVGNILLLVPLGMLLPFIFPNLTWKKALALAAGAGLSIEMTQSILHIGIFDVDDIILNALGVMAGWQACIHSTPTAQRVKTP